MKGKSQTSTTEVKGGDWVLRFEGGCEQILANAMLPSGVWKPNTVCCVCFNPIACLPLHQLTCQHLLLLICSLSWQTVFMPHLQVDPLGRALSSAFVPRRGERNGEKCQEEEEGRLSSAAGSFTQQKKKKSPLLFSPPLQLPAFSHLCCSANVDIAHVCTHTSANYIYSPMLSLSLARRTKTHCFWRGWPSLQSILLAQRR